MILTACQLAALVAHFLSYESQLHELHQYATILDSHYAKIQAHQFSGLLNNNNNNSHRLV